MTQDNERDPMAELNRQMRRIRGSKNASDARIRAAMLAAMLDGADKAEIEQMARAVGLNVQETDSTN